MIRHSRYVDGERIRYVEGPYETREQAETAAAKNAVDRPDVSMSTNITLHDWLEQWLADRFEEINGDENSSRYEQYRKHIIRVLPYLPSGLRVADTRRPDLETLLNRLAQQNLSSKYRRNIRSTIGLALESAVDVKIIDINPTRNVRIAASEREPLVILNHDDWATLVAHLQTSPESPYAIGCLIAATTGLRAAEVCGLTWQHIDLNAATISVQQQVVRRANPTRTILVPHLKTSRGRRRVSIPPQTVTALRAHRATLDVASISDHVVTSQSGGFGTPVGILAWIRKHAYPETGVPDLGMHGLRHTFASHLLSAGVDVVKVAYQMGHSNPNVTLSTYAHVTEAAIPEIGDTIGRLLGNPSRSIARNTATG